MTDLDLLRTEIETLWVLDGRGRLAHTREPKAAPAPHLVLGVAADGHCVALGNEVPDSLADQLEAAEATPAIPRCVDLLHEALGAVELSSGPSYVIPLGIAFESSAAVTRSDSADVCTLRGRRPAGWDTEDWQLLLDGALGPWAIATVEGRIASLCHCSRLGDRGAEAGVWTDPDFRGQGHAAATVAAWASQLADGDRRLFFSTSATNVSSQRVAARLELRQIGSIWQISRFRERVNP